MVSISTTLATNAIAEGKGKRVALFLIGYDPELIESFDLAGHFATPHFFYIKGGHDLHGQEMDDLDLPDLLDKVKETKTQVDAIAISSYFSPRNPEHEIRAQKAVASVCDLPIVLGHQLSTILGSIERATTAALNASLLTVLQEFIIAVRRAMERRGIDAPLMVVRGDGTLMNDEFAARTPVETIHSGPAASAIGGRFLSKMDNALVLDIGGTTTDLALVNKGQVAISEKGAAVAGYQTAVKAANLLSFGLGGDSHITVTKSSKIKIGPERVVPLAFLSYQYPNVKERIKALTKRTWPAPSPKELEYWFLQRGIEDKSSYTNREQDVIEVLKPGPMPAVEVLKALELLDHNQLDVGNLWREEILGKSGFTPTDILHTDGRYTPWDIEAAQAALIVFSQYLSCQGSELSTTIWLKTTEMIVKAIIHFLTEKEIPDPDDSTHDLANWFLMNTIQPNHDHLTPEIHLNHPIIGIGAPAEVMLMDASKVLNTELILPEYYQVANAAGAIAGSVMITEEFLIYPHLSEGYVEVIGYYVQARESRQEYEQLEEALIFAKETSGKNARIAALRSGADNPEVLVEVIQDGVDSYRVRAKAVGKPRLAQ
jgi:N-methylhydantoinase A/oxoprolinase/acetone carboxylase beta subunit